MEDKRKHRILPALSHNSLLFIEENEDGNEISRMGLMRTIVPNAAVAGIPEWEELPKDCPGYCTGEEIPPVLEHYGHLLGEVASQEIAESFKPIWGVSENNDFVTVCACGIWQKGHKGCKI